jgi:hypothetical protein
MRNFLSRNSPTDLLTSTLFNEETFYPTLTKDLHKSLHEVIIESPFVTNRRLMQLLPALQKLKDRKVRVIINTRDPIEHDGEYHREDAQRALASLQRMVYTSYIRLDITENWCSLTATYSMKAH